MSVFETWESPDKQARFCFSHSDEQFTTGVLILQPGAQLPKHNRPLAFENLLQLSGECVMTILKDEADQGEGHTLRPGDSLRMEKGQWHIHANPFPAASLTLFKAEGDITSVMKTVRETFTRIG